MLIVTHPANVATISKWDGIPSSEKGWAASWDRFNKNPYLLAMGTTTVGTSTILYNILNDGKIFFSSFAIFGGNSTNLKGESLSTYGADAALKMKVGAAVSTLSLPIASEIGGIMAGGLEDVAAKGGVNTIEQVSVNGNSLKSLKPTWGYKLYSEDGTFLKNGITNKLIPESRYTKAFMTDKYMEPIPFPNRLRAYQWEFQQNKILRGPLNFNMH